MAPADVPSCIPDMSVLCRIENQNVAAAQKLNQRSVLVRRNFSGLFRTQLLFRL